MAKKLSSLNKMLKFYEKNAKTYDNVYLEEQWRLYDDLTWHFTEQYVPTNRNINILDIGGGTGKWSIKLATLGYHVICADISPAMLDVAKIKIEKLNLSEKIQLKQSDIRDMKEFNDDYFDLVLALGDTISYALDDTIAVSELYRVTKFGGTVIASVDNKLIYILNEIKSERWDKIDEIIQTGLFENYGIHPIKAYFVNDLQELFKNAGFSIIKIIGKPVLSSTFPKKVRKRKLEDYYDRILNLEKRFCEDPSLIGHGGHLHIIAKKEK